MGIRILVIVIILGIGGPGCKKYPDSKRAAKEPVAVFNELWKVIDQRYALFAEKNVNWDSVYNQYKIVINNSMSDKQLFKKLGEMLEVLKDGHVALLSPFDTSVYTGFYMGYPRNFNYTNIVNNYLFNNYQTAGPIIYKIQNGIGYIYYSSFSQEVTEEQLALVFTKMANVKGIIVDVRNNTGGSVINAARLAKFFIPQKKLVKYELVKKGTGHNDFFNPQPFYLLPASISFNKPTAVLTNRSCYSACNDFVLYVSTLSNVTLLGDQTGGGGGIPYNYKLANGWILQYTATRTLSPTELPVENGIRPARNIFISSLDEAAGRDPVLEAAVMLLQ